MKRSKQATLHIGKPRLEKIGDKMRVVASVVHDPIPGVDGTGGDMWFAVAEPYCKYLCFERSDAFVVGMLYYSMRLGLDIVCDAPISEEILFNLRTYYIPALSKNCEEMYACKILAEPALDPLPNYGAVGTGISCGVDSLQALHEQITTPCKGIHITHLVLNNVGAYKSNSSQFKWQLDHARQFAKENKFDLVETDSNYATVFPLNLRWFHWTNTYANAFAVLSLQKFWGRYTLASAGWGFEYFNLDHILEDDPATYDLLFLSVISTRWLRFVSGGGAKTRFEKLRELIEYESAHKHIHVCTNDSGPNCNVCGKCIRTLVMLDALDALDKFSDVFDIDYYKKNRNYYLKSMYYSYLREGHVSFFEETYRILGNDLTLRMRLQVWYAFARNRLSLFKTLSKFYHLLSFRCLTKKRIKKENFGSLPERG